MSGNLGIIERHPAQQVLHSVREEPIVRPRFSFGKRFQVAASLLLGLVSVVGALFLGVLYSSLPQYTGTKSLRGLGGKVTVRSDRYAIPEIEADDREDAYRALGFVTARDRMFQLELFRRIGQGRLAEVFGPELVSMDRRQRLFNFAQIARQILARLPDPQRAVLIAYAQGVNAFLAQSPFPAVEFTLLGVDIEPWKPEHSLLVALNLFQALDFTGHKERMLSVMNRTLPQEVVAFLTPDSDQYSQTLVGGPKSRRPQVPVPMDSLAALYRSAPDRLDLGARIEFEAQFGSNGWVVGGLKTADGRAILANDMHLPLIVPNLWYRATLRYGDTRLSGITLPGLPLLVSGSNDRVAWGFTNALADVIDLITLDVNPRNEHEYAGPSGWLSFAPRHETIRVRGGEDVEIRVRDTVWGPVADKTLLGKATAVRWTALDPAAVDLALIDLDQVRNVDQAIALFNRAGSPVLNVMLADAEGNIGWTLSGKIPKRRGFDGLISVSGANPSTGWSGYLEPAELPRLKNPESGFIATANNLVVGKDYPHPIGLNYANGYRASRIRERLATMERITEIRMLELQSDTRTEFYDFYRDLALSVLGDKVLRKNPGLVRIRNDLNAWRGHADLDSRGMGILFSFRRRLAGAIILPLLGKCYAADANFFYSWFNMDTPLRQILSARSPEILPRPDSYANWDDLILKVLTETVEKLEKRHGVHDINELTWGDINAVRISHPFSRAVPFLSDLLDLQEYRLSGCTFCINVVAEDYGATERLVVSPGHHDQALLEMPGGQSAHFLSGHYTDLHPFWAKLLAMPLEPGASRDRLELIPSKKSE